MAVDHTQEVRRRPDSETAWQDWVRFVYPRVYYTVYRVTGGDVQHTEDLTQAAIERFLRYRAMERVKTDQDSVAYLVRTARRLNFDFVREQKNRNELHETIERTTEDEAVSTADQVSSALDFERLMKRLATPDRQLIRWLCAGWSVDEIATYLGISYTASATRIHRAKARLKKIAEDVQRTDPSAGLDK